MRKVQVHADRNRAKGLNAGTILAFLVTGILLCLFSRSDVLAQTSGKDILVLYSFANRHDFHASNDLKAGLERVIPEPLNLYVENLEGRRFDDQAYKRDLAANLRNVYRGIKLDLVLAENFPALEFAVSHRDEIFPHVPIVFYDVDAFWLAGQKLWPGVTGVTAPHESDIRGTINLGLGQFPNTGTVAVVVGDSSYERHWLPPIHAELVRHAVNEVDLIGLPASQLFARIAALPPNTIVMFQLDEQESPRPPIGAYEILAWIAQRRPTYCVLAWSPCLKSGGIGGDSYDGYRQISLVADIVKRAFSGEQIENIPIVHDSRERLVVDWRALQRWHIRESALPAGSMIEDREPTFWERYRRYIIPVMALIVAQASLIAALLWLGARKQKTEAVLRESEERFRTMADNTPSLIWMCDRRGRITYLNNGLLEFLGPDSVAYGDSWINYAHPDDVNRVLHSSSLALEARKPFSKQYRLRRSDGVYRWIFDVATPRLNGDGSFAGYIGSAIDVTDQKLAQQALEKVSGQLIEAQENERRRIARDLHDDICQRLALLSMELDQANRSANISGDVARERLREIRQHCSEIAADVQSLSHELHSSRLEYLGIAAAIRGFCHEFSKQHEVSIEFTDRDVPADLPRDISLCLFRVAQEALHNAVKYSGVSQYAVELTATAEEIQLVVSDAGKGFDVEAAKQNRGLGLVSMQERVHLVHGSLFVESEPGVGTRICAVVPLGSERRRSAVDNGADEPEVWPELHNRS